MSGETIRTIRRADPLYPERLRSYERMPERLYVLGCLPDPEKKSVAIVGARACSAYGKAETLRFSRTLARHGVQIISGMAHGIDSWAHIGALDAGGSTFAVFGCGVDVCYPPSHHALYARILSGGGGVLSEFDPGTKARPYHFPLRNRIISAMVDIVLVVEARRKSGSLITASYALEQGKNIYAVPGRNTDALSEGCNDLIADGAGVAESPETLLAELGLSTERDCAKSDGRRTLPPRMAKDPRYRLVWRHLSRQDKVLDELIVETGLAVSELTDILMQLCIAGCVAEDPDTGFVRL